ncbi:MAG: sigma 54-interacting transcriptional regulator [candidate division Zixibacteria bacterium]
MKSIDDKGTSYADPVAHYLEALVGERDFAGAIRYYESLTTEQGQCNPVSTRVLMLVAKAHSSLGSYPVALKSARLAQATVGHSDPLQAAEIFMLLGGILRDMGEVKEAERAFRDAESIFRRNDWLDGQSRALNQLAGLFFRQSDFRNSLTILLDAIEIAKKLNDKKKLAFMMGNVGRVCTFTGDFAKAEHHLKLNVELSRELGDDLETSRALLSLGYVCLQQANYDTAEENLDKARELIDQVDSKIDRVSYLTYLGELQYRRNRFSEAAEALNEAVILAQSLTPDGPALGRALRHMAELNCRQGNYRMALRHVSRAVLIMEKASDRVELGALSKLRGMIDDARKNAVSGRKHFKKAIDLLAETGVRFEKAEALHEAGMAELFNARQRMTYLFRAEEFYVRSRNRRKLEEIGRAIASLEKTVNKSAISHGTPGESSEVSASADYLTKCPDIVRLKQQVPMLASTSLPLLISGETGTGKDHMARFFHQSICPDAPFVAINCASVPDTLLESELFGYHRGAFTGADSDKEGLFVRANGGVLFLDEIGDMPINLQAKLLGVLERRMVTPLGSTEEVKLDFKLVAATNQDLDRMVADGSFRRDLYYRLSGISFHLPPLRERREDIGLLVEHFMLQRKLLVKGEKLPSELLVQFLAYDWPGNVRELQNRVSRLELMTQLVAEGDLVELTRSIFGPDEATKDNGSLFERVEQFERELLVEALTAAQGNKCEAARLLGVHEATVRTKLKRYGIMYQPSGLV